jgi:hypothetical protein
VMQKENILQNTENNRIIEILTMLGYILRSTDPSKNKTRCQPTLYRKICHKKQTLCQILKNYDHLLKDQALNSEIKE